MRSEVSGVLVINKPGGPTSHDIVLAARRILRAGKVGHTGTLDPMASGVLPLVLGRATRLAQFLTASDKEYEAEIELGAETTTYDRTGERIDVAAARPVSDITRAQIDDVLAALRGPTLQMPPSFSAKKIDGDRAYDLARRNEPVALEPVEVTAHALDLLDWSGAQLRLRLVCSAGYYVRSLAQEIGRRLGTGAHLTGLVRTRSGEFTLADAVSLEKLGPGVNFPGSVSGKIDPRPQFLVPMERLLQGLPAITMTPEGASLASRGGFLSAVHLTTPQSVPESGRVRLLHPDGHLVAIAEPRHGSRQHPSALLHPGVVLE